MKVTTLDEKSIRDIGHAFGYYDYGEETGMSAAFAEGDRLGVPVILETDAKSKCDKYVHLGMELAGTHDLGAFGKLYDLIRYPRYG